ncbi:hypothetical protein [Massilia aerilata]|uniref:Uncharacterized protein n=1 Tax=Massilia aerilata TaxID=453817 RepID=A0ABW0S099_9BURK
MTTQDLALAAFRNQCEGKVSRIESNDGPLVVVKQVFRNPSRDGMIDALVASEDGSEKTVAFTSLFSA